MSWALSGPGSLWDCPLRQHLPKEGPGGGMWEDGLQRGLDRAALAERVRPVLLGPGCQLCPPSALLALWLRAQGPGMARRT